MRELLTAGRKLKVVQASDLDKQVELDTQVELTLLNPVMLNKLIQLLTRGHLPRLEEEH